MICDQNLLDKLELTGLPDDISQAVRFFCGNGHSGAIEINPVLQGKGLGRVLWLLSSAVLEDKEVENIHIYGDTTLEIGQSQSFYDKLGATSIKIPTRRYGKAENNLEESLITVKSLSSKLNENQRKHLGELLSVPKDEIAS